MSNGKQHKAPTVSVVIPVYNNADRLRKVLEAVQQQDYPSECYEVIVVDNGSTDESPAVAKSFEGVRLLFETEYLGSPYSARNRGVEAAAGDIIAFLDSTCRPVSQWLREGVQVLRAEEADLVGGNIEFEFNGKVTAGKILDSLINIRAKDSVENRQVAKTGNLFVTRQVIRAVGTFPEGIRSGGDVRWTAKAVQAGFSLAYGSAATVYYPARPLGALLQKQWRVAKEQPIIWQEAGKDASFIRIVKGVLKLPSIYQRRVDIYERGKPFMNNYILQVWGTDMLVSIVMFAGRLYGKIQSWLEEERPR